MRDAKGLVPAVRVTAAPEAAAAGFRSSNCSSIVRVGISAGAADARAARPANPKRYFILIENTKDTKNGLVYVMEKKQHW